MLKRAAFSLAMAGVCGMWGFTGWFHATGGLGQFLFFAASGTFMLSLLFSLFEEPQTPNSQEHLERVSQSETVIAAPVVGPSLAPSPPIL